MTNPDWKVISEELRRQTLQCQIRFCQMKPSEIDDIQPQQRERQPVLENPVQNSPWTAEEDNELSQIASLHCGKTWAFIASQFSGRTESECRERWHNLRLLKKKSATLASAQSSVWSEEEDRLILQHHAWSKPINLTLLPGRTFANVSKHWQVDMVPKLLRYLAQKQNCKSSNVRLLENGKTYDLMGDFEGALRGIRGVDDTDSSTSKSDATTAGVNYYSSLIDVTKRQVQLQLGSETVETLTAALLDNVQILEFTLAQHKPLGCIIHSEESSSPCDSRVLKLLSWPEAPVFILKITDGGNAQSAGLKVGDVILELTSGVKMEYAHGMGRDCIPSLLSSIPIDTNLKIKVARRSIDVMERSVLSSQTGASKNLESSYVEATEAHADASNITVQTQKLLQTKTTEEEPKSPIIAAALPDDGSSSSSNADDKSNNAVVTPSPMKQLPAKKKKLQQHTQFNAENTTTFPPTTTTTINNTPPTEQRMPNFVRRSTRCRNAPNYYLDEQSSMVEHIRQLKDVQLWTIKNWNAFIQKRVPGSVRSGFGTLCFVQLGGSSSSSNFVAENNNSSMDLMSVVGTDRYSLWPALEVNPAEIISICERIIVQGRDADGATVRSNHNPSSSTPDKCDDDEEYNTDALEHIRSLCIEWAEQFESDHCQHPSNNKCASITTTASPSSVMLSGESFSSSPPLFKDCNKVVVLLGLPSFSLESNPSDQVMSYEAGQRARRCAASNEVHPNMMTMMDGESFSDNDDDDSDSEAGFSNSEWYAAGLDLQAKYEALTNDAQRFRFLYSLMVNGCKMAKNKGDGEEKCHTHDALKDQKKKAKKEKDNEESEGKSSDDSLRNIQYQTEVSPDEQGKQDEQWVVDHVYNIAEMNSRNHAMCETWKCNLVACARWKSDSGEFWNTCLDCQEKDYNGWPDDQESVAKVLEDNELVVHQWRKCSGTKTGPRSASELRILARRWNRRNRKRKEFTSVTREWWDDNAHKVPICVTRRYGQIFFHKRVGYDHYCPAIEVGPDMLKHVNDQVFDKLIQFYKVQLEQRETRLLSRLRLIYLYGDDMKMEDAYCFTSSKTLVTYEEGVKLGYDEFPPDIQQKLLGEKRLSKEEQKRHNKFVKFFEDAVTSPKKRFSVRVKCSHSPCNFIYREKRRIRTQVDEPLMGSGSSVLEELMSKLASTKKRNVTEISRHGHNEADKNECDISAMFEVSVRNVPVLDDTIDDDEGIDGTCDESSTRQNSFNNKSPAGEEESDGQRSIVRIDDLNDNEFTGSEVDCNDDIRTISDLQSVSDSSECSSSLDEEDDEEEEEVTKQQVDNEEESVAEEDENDCVMPSKRTRFDCIEQSSIYEHREKHPVARKRSSDDETDKSSDSIRDTPALSTDSINGTSVRELGQSMMQSMMQSMSQLLEKAEYFQRRCETLDTENRAVKRERDGAIEQLESIKKKQKINAKNNALSLKSLKAQIAKNEKDLDKMTTERDKLTARCKEQDQKLTKLEAEFKSKRDEVANILGIEFS
mmetsp:Transcript_34047/g.49355  ORF Transcript_34047/g.49355 Transcript_34047/m.49355 type:complete len:1506 (-) Transcript_34047:235-4752(-)